MIIAKRKQLMHTKSTGKEQQQKKKKRRRATRNYNKENNEAPFGFAFLSVRSALRTEWESN
jgi:hypothetical protein